jgi:dodecin
VGNGRASQIERRDAQLMTVASVTEISAVSPNGFEEAIREGVERATQTLRNIEGCWVKDMNVLMENNQIVGYKVNLAVTFVLEDAT